MTHRRHILRPHAEHEYADELAALAAADDRPRPPNWHLSPWAVVTYLLGGVLADGTVITPKYVGQRRLIEIAVATLATDRALLLLGVPGTAKTWVSEHLAAAISGDSTLLVQGTAGTTEESLRYGWNYARLLAEGPTEAALVPSPVYRAMRTGRLVRIEELTRMPSEVQDALVTILSEKVLPVPELDTEVAAVQGFNLIATANDRDRGINELSSALRRRFNTVVLPLPATAEEEMAIVARRVGELGAAARPAGGAGGGRRDPPRRDDLPRAARRRHRRRADEPQAADAARCRRPRRSRSSPTAWRSPPTSATARCGRPTSPAASSAPSSATRCTTRSPGASTSRGWSATATAGATSTTPAATSADAPADRPVPRLHLLGIRHHGPGSARSVRRALDELRPDVVLVEAPADAGGGAALDRRRRPRPAGGPARLRRRPAASGRSFAPLAEFSPEWQAVRWAAANGVAGRGDRPAAGRDARRRGRSRAAADRRMPRPTRSAPSPPPPASPTPSAGGRTSSSTAATASRRSTPSPRRWPPRAPGRGPSEADSLREAHMRRRIRAALAAGATVAVVCGAWHVPALDPRRVDGGRRCRRAAGAAAR